MTDELLEVWERVRDWPEEQQRSLAARINDSLAKKSYPRREALSKLYGLLATDQPPPTDDEVERLLEEDRLGSLD